MVNFYSIMISLLLGFQMDQCVNARSLATPV